MHFVLATSLNNTRWFWFDVDGFACIHLILERHGLRCFVQHRIKPEAKKREQQDHASETAKRVRPDPRCIRMRAFENTKPFPIPMWREEIKTKSEMNLSNFSFVDKNWYQNNFKYITILFTFSKSLRRGYPIGLVGYGIRLFFCSDIWDLSWKTGAGCGNYSYEWERNFLFWWCWGAGFER